MPASSTTSTHRSGSAGRRRSLSSAATLVLRIPASCSSSRAARRATATPSTGRPAACHASRAAPSANVLPVPALPTTTLTPSPSRHSRSTISRCSADSVGREATAARTGRSPVTPAPVLCDAATCRMSRCSSASSSGVEYTSSSRSIGSSRPSLRRYASPSPRAGSSATACGEARNRSVAASIARASTNAPAGSALAQRLEDIAARERRHASRQPGRRGELGEDPLPLRIVERRSVDAAEQPLELVVVEAELGRSDPPVRDELVDREVAALGLPGRERRRLGRARTRRPALRQRRLDLRAPAAERPQHRLGARRRARRSRCGPATTRRRGCA